MMYNERVQRAIAQGYTVDEIKQYAADQYYTRLDQGMSPADAKAYLKDTFGLLAGAEPDDMDRSEFFTSLAFMPMEEPGANTTKNASNAATTPGNNTTPEATNTTAKKQPDGFIDNVVAGYEHSVLGLMLRGQAPVYTAPAEDDILGNFAFSVGTTLGDIPATAVGAVMGAAAGTAASPGVGTVVGGFAGGSALPEMMRHVLMDTYENGAATSFSELMMRTGETLLVGGKAATVGAVTGKVGTMVAPTVAALGGMSIPQKMASYAGALTAETAAMVGTSAALDMRFPTMNEFINAGVALGGLKYATHNIKRFKQAYIALGLKPEEVRTKIMADPVFAEQFLTDTPYYSTPATREVYAIERPNEPTYSSEGRAGQLANTRHNSGRWLYLSPEKAQADFKAIEKASPVTSTVEQLERQWKLADTSYKRLSYRKSRMVGEASAKAQEEIFGRQFDDPIEFDTFLAQQTSEQQALYAKRMTELTDTKEFTKTDEMLRKATQVRDAVRIDYRNAQRMQPPTPSSTPLRELRAYDIPNTAPIIQVNGLGTASARLLVQKYLNSKHSEADPMVSEFRGMPFPNMAKTAKLANDIIDTAGPEFMRFLSNEVWTFEEIKTLVGPKYAKNLAGAKPGSNLAILGGPLEKDPNTVYRVYWAGLQKGDCILPLLPQLVTRATKKPSSFSESEAMRKVQQDISFDPGADKASWSERARDFYAKHVDRITALTKGTKDGQYSESYITARLASASAARAQYFIDKGTFDFKTNVDNGLSLREVLKDVPDPKALSSYVAARRAVAQAKKGKAQTMDIEAAKALVQEMDAKPEYKKAADALHDYNVRLMRFAKDAGIISEAKFNELSAPSEAYAPLQRIMSAFEKDLLDSKELHELASRAAKDPEAAQQLKDAREARRALRKAQAHTIDPLETVIGTTYLVMRAADLNRAKASIAREWGIAKAEQLGDSELGMLPGKSDTLYKISYHENGKSKTVYVQKDIYQATMAIDSMSRMMLSGFAKVLTAPASVLRAGAVLDPAFIARNTIRDQFTAAIQSKNGYRIGIDMIRGMGAIINEKTGGKLFKNFDGIYREWEKAGGINASLVSVDRARMRDSISTILKQPVRNLIRDPVKNAKQIADLVNPFPKALNALRELSDLAENAPRLGEYMLAREKGSSPKQAAFMSREVTMDFNRAGVFGRAWNGITAFYNAFVQGVDKNVRMAKENPVKFFAAHVNGVIVPTLLLAIAEQDMIINAPNSVGAQTAKELPEWERAAFWHLYVGDDYEHCLRIPKPHGFAAMMSAPIEAFVRWSYENGHTSYMDELVAAGFGDTVKTTFVPPAIPTAVTPALGVMSNYNFFTENKIASGSVEGLLPELQYQRGTTGTARAVAEALAAIDGKLGIPIPDRWRTPVAIDHLVQGYTGTLGMTALRTLDMAYDIYGGSNKPTKSWKEMPVVKAFFVKYPELSARSVEQFNKEYNEVQSRYQSVKALMSRGNVTDLQRAESIMLEGGVANLSRIKAAMGECSKMINLVYYSDQFTPDEKTQNIENITLNMLQIARSGLEVTRELKNARIERD